MMKKLIGMIFAVLCITAACALDAGGGTTQPTQTGITGAGTMKITITVKH